MATEKKFSIENVKYLAGWVLGKLNDLKADIVNKFLAKNGTTLSTIRFKISGSTNYGAYILIADITAKSCGIAGQLMCGSTWGASSRSITAWKTPMGRALVADSDRLIPMVVEYNNPSDANDEKNGNRYLALYSRTLVNEYAFIGVSENLLSDFIYCNCNYGGKHKCITVVEEAVYSNCLGNAASATDADMVDGCHASDFVKVGPMTPRQYWGVMGGVDIAAGFVINNEGYLRLREAYNGILRAGDTVTFGLESEGYDGETFDDIYRIVMLGPRRFIMHTNPIYDEYAFIVTLGSRYVDGDDVVYDINDVRMIYLEEY